MPSQNKKSVQTPLNKLKEFCKTYQLEDPSQELEEGLLSLIKDYGDQVGAFANDLWFVQNCCPRFILDCVSKPAENRLSEFKTIYVEARQKFYPNPEDFSVL